MRNLKKFLALVLAMMMTLSLMVTVNAAAPATPTDFADKDSITQTYGEAVSVLSALGIVKGDDGFRPGDTITRAEVSAMLYRIAHNDAGETQVKIYKDYDVFPDVKSDKWYAGAVNYCANSGYLKGYPDGSFGPSKEVTGYEVLVMTLRMLGYGKNGEFEGKQGDWRLQAAMYGRKAGLTKQIKEGTLGAPATREMVAEIMFQALLADLVDYNLLQNYYPSNVLLADDATNRTQYKNAIDMGLLTLPRNADLMYVNYGIVGKSPRLAYDSFGRPSEAWVKDVSDRELVNNADGKNSMYVPNDQGTGTNDNVGSSTSGNEDFANRDETPILVPMTPVKVYDNSVTECNLSKDINSDRSIAWTNIREVLNGDWDGKQSAAGFGPADGTLDLTGVDRTGNMDALHTTVDYIGATGRTTEIYKFTVGTTTKWVFVYIDTFLGEVVSTTPAIKDSAGHVIKKATADIDVANDDGYKTLTLETEAYEEGELVLIQTPAGAQGTPAVLDTVDSPERAPLIPSDVPNDDAKFTSDAVIVSTRPTTVRVTVNATVGEQDNKMGVIGTDGKTYMASNTFLAARTGDNDTVLADWYDIPVPAKGITNNMIGRTFDLVLDHHGYIVGMDEVLTVNSSVGVITGVDNVRIGTGKYLSEVEAYMADGTTKTFQIPRLVVIADGTDGTLATSVDPDDTTQTYGFFPTATAADDAWDAANTTMYGDSIGIGSLVKFANVTIDGQSYWKIDDYDGKADQAGSDGDGAAPTITNPALTTKVGTLKASAVAGATSVLPGDTDALFANRTIPMLDDKSVMFVTEYDYRYNTGNDNEGSNVDMTYKVYNGFKTMPTIEVGTAGQIVYQRLDKNPEYFLIGKVDACNDYIIKNQPTITVDESYLLLSRGATYAEYSEYNVLKNGELTTLKVANGNDKVNAAIEQTLTGSIGTPLTGTKANHENQLIVVTGTNSKGYVTSVTDTWDMAQASASAAHKALVAANSNNIATGVRIVPDAAPLAEDGSDTGIRAYSNSVLQLATGAANNYLTIADGCKVKLVNRDLGTTYDISLNEAIRYANGVDSDTTDDAVLPSHGVVFELDQYGYVCALYVIDDWNEAAT